MILYAVEDTDHKKSVLATLDNLINRAVFKIFKVSDKLVIRDITIRHFLGLHDVASLREMRRIKFLNKTRALTVINGTVLLFFFSFLYYWMYCVC